jgi:hypothetical protein
VTEEPNYLAHAFKSQYNLIGLGTAVGFAVLAASGLPLLLALGVELAVLPLVAGSERFQRLVRARLLSEERTEKEQKKQVESAEMLRALPDTERTRYRGLETLTAEIRENYKGLDASSRVLLDELVQKLDFLLGFYLRMRYSVSRYDGYFATTDDGRIQHRIAALEREMKEGPERIQQIKARTKSVLEKRLERYSKAVENRQLVDAQTETVLEVMQLLRDQSFSMRDPRTITEQLDGLVSSAEETERGVRDMEDILSTDDDLLGAGLSPDIEAELRTAEASPTPKPTPQSPVKETATSSRIRALAQPAAPTSPRPLPPVRKKLPQ